VLIADRSVFHPQGGGQPSDTGTITLSLPTPATFQVSFVTKKDGGVLEHYGTPSDGFLATLQGLPTPLGDLGIGLCMEVEGEKVEGVMGAMGRKVNAATHSGGHAVDVAMQRCGYLSRFGLTATKGYHFSDGPYVEFEMRVGSEEPAAAELETMPSLLNEALASIVAEAIPTTVATLPRAEAGALCGCDTSTYPEEVRVVTVAGLPCPCGGTHVKSSADLGGVRVTKVRRKKRILKVSYTMTG
jgi:Ser-tRNA(Ala) deacylase AlaX